MKRIAALLLLACLSANAKASFDPFIASDIRIDGLERISAGTVFTYLPIEDGDAVTESDVQQAIRALFRTGFFSDISFSRQGDILVIKVAERPAISKITLRGNKDIKTEDLMKGLNQMGMTEGGTFDRLTLDQLQQELIRQYYNRGKYNVTVEPHVTHLARNRVSLDIEIREGEVARIKSINIVGNSSYSDADIRKDFESDTSNWTSWYSKDDQYSQEKLSGDLEKLSSFYLDRGYANFDIKSTEVTISPDKQRMHVSASISEGEIYNISEIELRGDLVLPQETIQKLIRFDVGDRFSRAAIERTKKTIVGVLSNIGYAFAEVTPIPEIDREDHTVKVTLFVEPGDRVYVRRMNFIGNTRTEGQVLRRELRQYEGGWYSQAAIDRSKIRLQRLGHFKTVEVEKKRVPGTRNMVDVNFTVEEQAAGSLLFGIGYSQLLGLSGSFSVSQNNFLGTGNRFSAALMRNSYIQQYNLSYLDPYLTDSGVSVAYNLNWSEFDRGSANIANYLYSVRSFSSQFGIPISETGTISLGLGVGSNTIDTGPGTPDALVDYINTLGNRTIHSWTGSLSWGRDTRDRYFLPTRGGSQYLSAEVALPGSTVELYKLSYQLDHYWRMPYGFVLYSAGGVSYGDTYGDSSELGYPFWENYYAGGVNDVRGFRANTLGPRTAALGVEDGLPIGGSLKVKGTAELYLPIPALQESGTARIGLFLDVGNVYKDFDSFDAGLLRASAGIALQWRAPIGPITISLAEPLRYQSRDRRYIERIQFTFGSQF